MANPRALNRLSRRGLLTGMTAAVMAPALVRAERRWALNEYFEVTHLEVPLSSIDPAHDGLRIAQLSDLHIGSGVPDSRILAAIRAVNELKPDLVMLTGDFITNKRDPVSLVPQLLGQLEVQPVAVLGNHDHWTYPEEITNRLESLGITVLRNQHTAVRLNSVDLSVIGVDDSTTKNDDVGAAFKNKPTGSRLVLTHTPSGAKKLPEHEGLLVLSGHTHGGQFEFAGITKGVFRTFGQPWYRGAYRVRGNHLYVNRGLGFGHGTRMPRINSDPEVTLFTLRHAELS
jgi:predicted MPP superfamily phosphohydrolase